MFKYISSAIVREGEKDIYCISISHRPALLLLTGILDNYSLVCWMIMFCQNKALKINE